MVARYLIRPYLLTNSGIAASAFLPRLFSEKSPSLGVPKTCSESFLGRERSQFARKQEVRRLLSASSSSRPEPTAIPPPSKDAPSFTQWYESHLHESPILTKSVTGSILWGVGDAVAQTVPHLAFGDQNADGNFGFFYDWQRTGRAVAFGGVLHAPTSHVHFNFLEWMTVRSGLSGLAIPVFKTVMEQFVYWSWLSNSMYHGAMGAMQGLTLSQIYDRIEAVLWETQKAQWAFWIPVQLLNFRFVPVRHQLNVVLLTSIVWTALLSMWYPPVKSDKATESKSQD